MVLLNLFKSSSARGGPPVRIKVPGVRMKLSSHPFSPRMLPSTVCEADASKGAAGADEVSSGASRVISHQTFSVFNVFSSFHLMSHYAINFVCFQELFRDTSPYWDLVLMDFIYTDHSSFILFISPHFIQKVCIL